MRYISYDKYVLKYAVYAEFIIVTKCIPTIISEFHCYPLLNIYSVFRQL